MSEADELLLECWERIAKMIPPGEKSGQDHRVDYDELTGRLFKYLFNSGLINAAGGRIK